MIVLLSPAKSLNFDPVDEPRSQPRFKKDTVALAEIMKKKSSSDLREMMKISQKLADLNRDRFQDFTASHTKKNAKQAIFAFQGDVYQGLQAEHFTKSQLAFAQDHVRILSGLYGLLRPFDVIQPYRLEMGSKVKTKQGKSLYDFWGDALTEKINEDLKAVKSKVVVNLASEEYFKAINKNKLEGELYTPNFKEYRDSKLKFISFSAKKARGFMTQYIVRNKITKPEKLKGFDLENYAFDEAYSNPPFDLIFTR